MERNIDYRLFWKLIKDKTVIIIIMSIVFSLFYTSFSFLANKEKIEAQVYGAFTELYISSTEFDVPQKFIIDENNDKIRAYDDFSADTIVALSSHEFLEKIMQDKDVQDMNVSLSELKSMLHFKSGENSKLVQIYAVSNNLENAMVVSKKILKYGTEYLADKGIVASVQQPVESLGVVDVVVQDSTAVQGEKVYLINQSVSSKISIFSIFYDFVIGIIAGLILSSILIILIFILRDKIIYPSQIEDSSNINVITTSEEFQNHLKVYASTRFCKKNIMGINFIPIKMTRYREFIFDLVKTYEKYGNKVLVLEVLNAEESTASLEVYDREGCCYATCNIGDVLNESKFIQILENIKSQYDNLFFIHEIEVYNSINLAVSRYCDETIMMIEANSLTIKELQKFIKKENDNIDIKSAIFFS